MKWFWFWMREQRKWVKSAFQQFVSVCKVSIKTFKAIIKNLPNVRRSHHSVFVIHSVLMCLNWINGLFQATDSHSLTQSAHCCPPLLPLTHCSLLQWLNAEHQNRVWQIKCTPHFLCVNFMIQFTSSCVFTVSSQVCSLTTIWVTWAKMTPTSLTTTTAKAKVRLHVTYLTFHYTKDL